MINNIITAMEEMEVGEEDMTEGDDLTEDKKSEEEGGGTRGPPFGTGSHRATNSGYGARRHKLC